MGGGRGLYRQAAAVPGRHNRDELPDGAGAGIEPYTILVIVRAERRYYKEERPRNNVFVGNGAVAGGCRRGSRQASGIYEEP